MLKWQHTPEIKKALLRNALTVLVSGSQVLRWIFIHRLPFAFRSTTATVETSAQSTPNPGDDLHKYREWVHIILLHGTAILAATWDRSSLAAGGLEPPT